MMKRKRLTTLALMLVLTVTLTAAAQAEVKNMILLVGDGLGIGQMDMARYFEGGKDHELEMMKLPHVGLMMTSSAEGITDSAAAGTAMATRYKTNNGMVGMTPSGAEVDSVLDFAQVRGKSTGIISTNTVNDATPAAFATSAKDRGDDEAISRQIIENDVDVVLGGGGGDFTEEILTTASEKGYEIVKTENELASVDSSKVLGLFNDSYMNYTLDRDDVDSKEPSQLEMTKKAIETLSQNENGFFLMSEGARIDHAAHAADIPGVVAETMAFDKTVEYAVNWAKENGDTLVVVVADHETMGIDVSEAMNVEALKDIEVSPEYMAAQMNKKENGNGLTISSIKNVFEKYADIELTNEEAKEFNQSVLNDDGSLFYTYKIGWKIGSVISKKYNVGVQSAAVRAKSSTGGHTLNSVPIFAYGEGAEKFDDVMQNTELSELLFDAFKPAN